MVLSKPVKRATIRQLNRIRELRHLLFRFSDADWDRWLARRFGVRAMVDVRDWVTAQKIIGGLANLQRRREFGQANRHLRALGRAARQSR